MTNYYKEANYKGGVSFMKKNCQLQVIQYLIISDPPKKKLMGGGRYLTRDNRYTLDNCSKQQLKFYRSHLLNCYRTSHEIFVGERCS